MPVLARRRHEIREPVELTFGRQGHPWPLPANGEGSTTPLALRQHQHRAGWVFFAHERHDLGAVLGIWKPG
jgi:hypothetical protein